MTLDEAIRLFLRRSVRERGLPFPMRRMSEMEKADVEIHEAMITGKGLVSYATNKEARRSYSFGLLLSSLTQEVSLLSHLFVS